MLLRILLDVLKWRQNKKRVYAFGFSNWKRKYLRKFLKSYKVKFVKNLNRLPDGAEIYIWGNEKPWNLPPGLKVWRVEDGFLRSHGLGVKKTKPLSWIFDDLGIYYDERCPSKLEFLINNFAPTISERNRAASLIEQICHANVTKYNLRGGVWERPKDVQRVILVVGQVESDASITYGSQRFKTNIDFLKFVREENKNSYIIYKSHPDIVMKEREGEISEKDLKKYADEELKYIDPVYLFELVDEVHVMTSLMGFEALLRGCKVTCYGMPFYAGWGLTQDLYRNPRRTRIVDLEILVHAALIQYPCYIDLITDDLCTVEDTVHNLVKWRDSFRKK